jgi:hypothetical protein
MSITGVGSSYSSILANSAYANAADGNQVGNAPQRHRVQVQLQREMTRPSYLRPAA